MTQNQIAYQTHLENKRANRAREDETHRSNVANEEENRRFHADSIAETKRSNIAREFETNRANVARENETSRSNLANEMLKATDIQMRSEDSRYATDVGYQGRVDSAYINKWGVSPTDVSSLATTVGKGVKKVAPAAARVSGAAADLAKHIGVNVAFAPARIVHGAALQLKRGIDKIISDPSNKSTNNQSQKTGGHRHVKKKFSK